MLRVVIYGTVILLSWAAGRTAHGEERHVCTHVKGPYATGVLCDEKAFDTLVHKLVDLEAKGNAAQIKLDAEKARADDLDAALKTCVQSIPPPPPPPPAPPSAFRRVLPVALGIVGAGILVGSAAIDAPAGVQVSGAVVGLVAVTTGVVLAF